MARRCCPEDLILGADTIVVLDGKILGKPRNAAHAFQMLSSLSTRRHTVYTGLALIRGEEQMLGAEATQVRFCNLTEQEILDYISTGEPMDKAGAYGIQERALCWLTASRATSIMWWACPSAAWAECWRALG